MISLTFLLEFLVLSWLEGGVNIDIFLNLLLCFPHAGPAVASLLRDCPGGVCVLSTRLRVCLCAFHTAKTSGRLETLNWPRVCVNSARVFLSATPATPS